MILNSNMRPLLEFNVKIPVESTTSIIFRPGSTFATWLPIIWSFDIFVNEGRVTWIKIYGFGGPDRKVVSISTHLESVAGGPVANKLIVSNYE